VLVAIVGGASAAVAALITGVLKFLERRKENDARITLRGADGTSVQVPASITPERLKELAKIASELEKPVIHISGARMRKVKGPSRPCH